MDGIRTGTLAITPATLKLIAEIDEFKGRWEALKTLSPDRLSALRKVATIESVGLQIPIDAGQGFRFEAGRHSDLMSDTIPI